MATWRERAIGAVALGAIVVGGACAPDPSNEPSVPPSTTAVPNDQPLTIVTRLARAEHGGHFIDGDPRGVELIASGASGEVTWSVERGTLPSWLELGTDGVFRTAGVESNAGPSNEPVERFIQVRATDGASTTTGLVYFHTGLSQAALLTEDELPSGVPAGLPDGTELVLRDRARGAAFGIGASGTAYAVTDEVFVENIARIGGSATSAGPVVHVDSAWPYAGEPAPSSPSGRVDYLDARTGEVLVTVDDLAMSGIVSAPWIHLMSPDRSKVLTATHSQAAPEGGINIVDVDTATVLHVVPGDSFGEWTWSADGQWLVVQSDTAGTRSIDLRAGAGFATTEVDMPDGECRPLSITSNSRVAVACAPGELASFLDQSAVYSVPLDGSAPELLIGLGGEAGVAKAEGSICELGEVARYWPFDAYRHAVVSPSGRYLAIQERCLPAGTTGVGESGATARQIVTIDLVSGGGLTPLFAPVPGGGRGDVAFNIDGMYWR